MRNCPFERRVRVTAERTGPGAPRGKIPTSSSRPSTSCTTSAVGAPARGAAHRATRSGRRSDSSVATTARVPANDRISRRMSAGSAGDDDDEAPNSAPPPSFLVLVRAAVRGAFQPSGSKDEPPLYMSTMSTVTSNGATSDYVGTTQ